MSISIVDNSSVPTSPLEWLRTLQGAALVWLPGPAALPARALSVLLHGNEPSGLAALHRYLAEGRAPARRTLCFVGSVEAALATPPARVLPGRRDLNRCFFGPASDDNGALALELLGHLREAEPEALIDLHNNSGHNPAYGVIADTRPMSLALVELFTPRAVLNTLQLGTLVEAQALHCPSVVIECGQAGAPEADEVAYLGLCRYLEADTLAHSASPSLQVYRNTVRFELRPGIRPAFALEAAAAQGPLILRADLERFNFQTLPRGEVLGWYDMEQLPIVARDAHGRDRASEYLTLEAGVLRARRDFRPIMMSVRPEVVLDDCLCYLVDEHTYTPAAPNHLQKFTD